MDQEASHAYCQNCDGIEVAIFEDLRGISYDSAYLAGHVLCARCLYVIATLFKERK